MSKPNELVLCSILVLMFQGSLAAFGSAECEKQTADAKGLLGEALVESHGKEVAQARIQKAIAAFEVASHVCEEESRQASDPRESATFAGRSVLNKAKVLFYRNETEEAIQALRDGIERIKSIEGDRSPALIDVYETLGSHLPPGHYQEKRGLLEEALEIRKVAYGADDLRVVDGLIYVGSWFAPSKDLNPEEMDGRGADFDLAESYFREAIRISIAYDGLRLDDILASFLPMLRFQGGRENDLVELEELRRRYER